MSTLNIEPGKFYKTRASQKAHIYSIHGGEHDFPIHGAILVGNDRWVVESWNVDGILKFSYESPLDLVSPWIDPPVVDWEKLPKHIVAVAKDGDKRWYGFTTANIEIKHGVYNDEWEPSEQLHAKIRLRTCFDFAGDWRESLAVRPGHEA